MKLDRSSAQRRGSGAEDRVVDLLRTIHSARRGRGAPGLAGRERSLAPAPTEDSAYDRAREHFVKREERLREEAHVSAAVIDDLRARDRGGVASAPSPTQQLLRISALQGGLAGGRFAVASDRPEPVELRFEHSGLRRGVEDRDLGAPVRFDPASLVLVPKECRIVRVEIDLADVACAAPERLELRVEVEAGGRRWLTLWVEVDVLAPPRELWA